MKTKMHLQTTMQIKKKMNYNLELDRKIQIVFELLQFQYFGWKILRICGRKFFFRQNP